MKLWELVARESIRATIAQYTYAGDRALIDQMADTFCEDGVLETGRDQGRWVGRAAIAQRLGGGVPAGRASRESDPHVLLRRHHIVTDLHIEQLTPRSAVVSSYFTVLTRAGLDHYGRYSDRLVPIEDRWLFAHRIVTRDWQRSDVPATSAAPSH